MSAQSLRTRGPCRPPPCDPNTSLMERLKFALDSCVGTGRRRAFPFEHGVFAPHSKLRTARNRARRLQLARGPQARLDARADRVELDVAHEAQQVATCFRKARPVAARIAWWT